MVGQKTKKPIVFKFSQAVSGLPYSLGESSGLDCFSLIVEYLKHHRIIVSENETIDGVTLKNYKDKYIENEKTIEVGEKYLSKILKAKEVNKVLPGDILMLEYEGKKFFGIDVGNGNVLTVNLKSGVKTVKKSIYRILKAWAIQYQQA